MGQWRPGANSTTESGRNGWERRFKGNQGLKSPNLDPPGDARHQDETLGGPVPEARSMPGWVMGGLQGRQLGSVTASSCPCFSDVLS